MHLLALQNQHGACFSTEEKKQNCFLICLFLILCAPFEMIFLELGKMQFSVQGITT